MRGGEGPSAAGHLIETFGRFAVGGSLVVGLVDLPHPPHRQLRGRSPRARTASPRWRPASPSTPCPASRCRSTPTSPPALIDDRGREAHAARTWSTRPSSSEPWTAQRSSSAATPVAGLAITGINIVGGLIAGVAARPPVAIASAAETFTLLTVGDGLVSQIPALLVSTAAGLVVTRAAGRECSAPRWEHRSSESPDRSRIAAGVLVAIGLFPGMPLLAFLAWLAAAFLLSRDVGHGSPEGRCRASRAAREDRKGAPKSDADSCSTLDTLELEVGMGSLVRLIDLGKGGELPGRVTALRGRLLSDLGVVLPSVHLRDNLGSTANSVSAACCAEWKSAKGMAYVDRADGARPLGARPGHRGACPVPRSRLRLAWRCGSSPRDRARAERAGLTVVDPPR